MAVTDKHITRRLPDGRLICATCLVKWPCLVSKGQVEKKKP